MDSILKAVCAAACLMGFIGGAVAADGKPDAREHLETVIPEAIRLLKAEEHEALLRTFVDPEDLKKITESQSLEDLAKDLREGKAAMLLEVLLALEGKTPKIDADGTRATYTHGVEDAHQPTIVFAKVGKYWYIKN